MKKIKSILQKVLNLQSVSAVILFIGIFVLFLSTMKGTLGNPTSKYIMSVLEAPGQALENSPERNRYSLLMAMVDYHSFTLPLNVAETVVPDLGYVNGKYISIYPPGFTIVMLPFYALGKIFNVAQLSAFFSVIVFAIISFYLIIRTSKKLNISEPAGILSAFIFFFATSAWAYTTTVYQYYVEIVIFLVLINLLMSKLNFWKSGLIWLLVFYTITIDNVNIFFQTPIMLFFLFKNSTFDYVKQKINIKIQKSQIFGIILILPLLLAWMFFNSKVYGKPLTISFSAQSIRKFDSHNNPIIDKSSNTIQPGFDFFRFERFENGISVLTISPDRGLLWFSPVMLLSLLGVPVLFKKNKQIAKLLLAMALTIFFVYAAWEDPWGGWGFGARYMIPVFSIVSIFMAQAIDAYKNKVWFLIILIATGIYSLFINSLGAVTSNQIPPLHEAIGLHMKYNFLLDWDYLLKNVSGSFIYNYFLRSHISLLEYFLGIFAFVCLMFVTLVGVNLLRKNKI